MAGANTTEVQLRFAARSGNAEAIVGYLASETVHLHLPLPTPQDELWFYIPSH